MMTTGTPAAPGTTAMTSTSQRHRTMDALRIICLNPWSVCNKTTSIHDFIIDEKPDLLCITETWLSGTASDGPIISAILPDGYEMQHNPRGSRGGGVAIVHRTCIPVLPAKEAYQPHSYELLECIVKAAQTFRICVVYHPPKNNSNAFIDDLADHFELLAAQREPLLIVGDFNLHMDAKEDRHGLQLKNLIDTFGLVQHISEPTHRNGHILDLVISRDSEHMVTSVDVRDKGFPDHFSVFIRTNFRKPSAPRQEVTYRKTKGVTREDLTAALADTVQITVQATDMTLQDLVSTYSTAMGSILDDVAPLKTRTIVCRPKSEWYNDKIREAKQERRRAERKWRSSGLHVHRGSYIEQRDRTNRMIESAKESHYQTLISECKDTKQLFAIVNKLLGKTTQNLPSSDTESSLQLAQSFNVFFVEKIERIRLSIPLRADPTPPHPPVYCCLNEFQVVNEQDVLKIIASSPSKSCGLDPMPTHLLKLIAPQVAPIITEIINQSLVDGVFPAAFKNAHVRPLIKKNGLDPSEMKNFRPVANLNFVSKLVEKVVAGQLTSYLEANDLFDPNQSAYRAGHSTETALLHVFDDITRQIGERKAVLFVMVDLSAAFDTVDHCTLMETLHRLGISGTAAGWLKSYLQHRQQCVVVNDAKSDFVELDCGVPQGSVLGPLLFSIYTSSLGRFLNHYGVHYHFYADDTQIWLPFDPDEMDDAIARMKKCLQGLQGWMQHFKLKMNCEKTEFMILASQHLRSRIDATRNIEIAPETVSPSNRARNLGVVMSPTLSLDAHVSALCKSAYAQISAINKIKRFMDARTLETIMHAFVSNKLDYCNSLLLGAPAYLLARVQKIQNVAARIIAGAGARDHITPVLHELHWLPIKRRIDYKVFLIMHKTLNGNGAPILDSFSFCDNDAFNLRSNSTNFLNVPFTTSSLIYERCFSVAGPRMWNTLPLSLRTESRTLVFKKKLKTFLFQSHFH